MTRHPLGWADPTVVAIAAPSCVFTRVAQTRNMTDLRVLRFIFQLEFATLNLTDDNRVGFTTKYSSARSIKTELVPFASRHARLTIIGYVIYTAIKQMEN